MAAIALVLVIASFATYEYYASSQGAGKTTLVVLTYPSFFSGNACNQANLTMLMDQFGSAHDVSIQLECPLDGNLVSILESPADYLVAVPDVVVGLDEITAPEAQQLGLLYPYTPPELSSVPPWLASELDPAHGVVPYEYGFLGIDYTSAFWNETDGAVAHATLPEIVGNSSWTSQLVTENPLTDITGEEFLVWEIEYYENVLHRSWQEFWSQFSAKPHPTTADSWSTAFNTEFNDSPGQNQMVVSYSTDPAYAAANGAAGTLGSTVSWWNGTAYGWRTIYGVGVVNGTRHVTLAEELEQYILQGEFQSYLPTNEWEYPANETVELPSSFSAAIDPATVVALNNDTTPGSVAANLTASGGWLDTWQSLAGD